VTEPERLGQSSHPIITHAQAYSSGQEQHTLTPVLLKSHDQMRKVAGDERILHSVAITADSGFHSEAIYKVGIDAYIADNSSPHVRCSST